MCDFIILIDNLHAGGHSNGGTLRPAAPELISNQNNTHILVLVNTDAYQDHP